MGAKPSGGGNVKVRESWGKEGRKMSGRKMVAKESGQGNVGR